MTKIEKTKTGVILEKDISKLGSLSPEELNELRTHSPHPLKCLLVPDKKIETLYMLHGQFDRNILSPLTYETPDLIYVLRKLLLDLDDSQ